MAEIEILLRRGRRIEVFETDIDPDDEIACVALLRRRAVELRRPVSELRLRTRGKNRRFKEYRAL